MPARHIVILLFFFIPPQEIEANNCSEVIESTLIALGDTETEHFSRNKTLRSEQVDKVLENVFNPTPGQKLELELLFDGLGKLKPQIWDKYFEVYSEITWSSSGYQDIIDKASQALPLQGVILDVGSGTGNFVRGLFDRSPNRTFIAIDNSERGLQIIQQKAHDLSIPVKSYKGNIISTSLRNILGMTHQTSQRPQAAMMNNVLYTIKGTRAKLKVLRSVFDVVPNGSIFF